MRAAFAAWPRSSRPSARRQSGRRRLGDEGRHGRAARPDRQGRAARARRADAHGAARAPRDARPRSCSVRRARKPVLAQFDARARRHREHPEGPVARAVGVAPQPRPRRRASARCGRRGRSPRSSRPSSARAREVVFVNARDVLVIEQGEMGPVVAWDASRPKLTAAVPAGLQRRGRDHGLRRLRSRRACRRRSAATAATTPASIFGALLDADEVHIWTDVDGVMSGDPRRVPEAEDHRRDVVQRGDGARVLRREGDPPADDGAGRRSRHPDLDSQHVQSARIPAPRSRRRRRIATPPSRASAASTASRS